PLLLEDQAAVQVRDEGGLLRHRSRVGLPGRQVLVGRDAGGVAGRRTIEGDRLELAAEATLELEGEVVPVLVERHRRAGGVRAAEQVGLVAAGVIAAGGAVAVGVRAGDDREAPVLVDELRVVEAQEGLVDAQVGFQPAVARVGDVVRRDLDGRLHPVVAVVEVELGPGADHAVRVAPVDVVGVRYHRRRAQLGAGVARGAHVRVPGGRRSPRQAQRRPEVAGDVELPLAGRLLGRGRDDLRRRGHEPADLRGLRVEAQGRPAAALLLGRRGGRALRRVGRRVLGHRHRRRLIAWHAGRSGRGRRRRRAGVRVVLGQRHRGQRRHRQQGRKCQSKEGGQFSRHWGWTFSVGYRVPHCTSRTRFLRVLRAALSNLPRDGYSTFYPTFPILKTSQAGVKLLTLAG